MAGRVGPVGLDVFAVTNEHSTEACSVQTLQKNGVMMRHAGLGDMLKKCQQSSKTRTPQAENQLT